MVNHWLAVGASAGRRALTPRTLPGRDPDESPVGLLARADAFCLHAGVTVGATDAAKRERLYRYLARSPVTHDRLSLTRDGRGLRAEDAVPGRGPRVILQPQDFIARLAALVPGPPSHLTRYHGVFAPPARWRSLIVPGRPPQPATDRTPAERRKAMTWAQRLARVLKIDVTRCEYCGGLVRIIATLTDQSVLDRILAARNGTGRWRGAGAGFQRHRRCRHGPEAPGLSKGMTTHADHRIWQDVYRPATAAGEVYLKLTVIDDVLIVSFKELRG